MTWNELQAALYEEYEANELVHEYETVFDVPGGGDYSNMTIEVFGFRVDHDKRRVVLNG